MNNYSVLYISPENQSLLQRYDEFISSQPTGHLLQTNTWVDLQRELGRTYTRLLILDGEIPVLGALLIEYDLPVSMNYVYAPCGPVVAPEHLTRELLALFAKEAGRFSPEALFFRTDPRLTSGEELFRQGGFLLSKSHLQPIHTRILPLVSSIEEILGQMKPKTRYNIRLAEKKSIRIEESKDQGAIDSFYELMTQTSERDEFHPHSKEYYKKLVETLGSKNMLSIFTAYKDASPIASIIVSYWGTQATYLHGASDYAHRNLMAPYLLQWQAIQQAKSRGCTSYDFWGISPEGAPDDAWAGVTRFKEGFGGKRVDYIGTLDYPFRPLLYKGYALVKSLRRN